MRETRLAAPYVGLIAVTRVALGAGIGLLVANNLSATVRQRAGWALFGVGALSTIPLMRKVLAGMEPAETAELPGARFDEPMDAPVALHVP